MKKLKFNYLHIICIVITLGFLACTAFLFLKSIFRIIESGRDFGLSIAFYFAEIFGLSHSIVPTVNNMPASPAVPAIFLPETWQGFGENWNVYWETFITKENFVNYLYYLSDLALKIMPVIIFSIPFIIVLVIMFRRSFTKQNNDYNVDSKPLRAFKWVIKWVYTPVKSWIKGFVRFVISRKYYWVIWCCIWALNFNLVTIFLETFAYYFYFVAAFELNTLYIQLYKLILDLAVPLTTVPWFIWVVLGLYVFNRIRKRIALSRLNHFEMRNRGFINARPITFMDCGSMGKKKTTMVTDMALSQEVMFRDKAFEKLLENDLKFPNFPWINLENTLIYLMDKHVIYNLATIKRFIRHLEGCFLYSKKYPEYRSAIARHLRKKYGVDFENFLFDYDYKRYGLTYDDKLKVVGIWDVLETYSQLYFVYVIKSSLLISNYSIRTDGVLSDVGNFPIWNNDFFTTDSKLVADCSRHAHILDFDMLRLGRKVLENNPNADSFEFGVVVITEVGKERGNSLELLDKKKKDEITNQKNDLFNYSLKMVRHSATIDNFPFVKVMTDEQRPESWGADARALCDIIHIRESGETRLALPFFHLGELLHELIFNKFTDLYSTYRYNRSDNTLLMYLLKGISSRFHNYYTRTYNRFGYCVLDVQVENGVQDGNFDDCKYYLMHKKIYSNRFSTDCHSGFFNKKALRSKVGLNDLPTYKTVKATFGELEYQKSYFIADLTNNLSDKKGV